VFWPDLGYWYKGTVTRYLPDSQLYVVTYDEPDKNSGNKVYEENLAVEKWALAEDFEGENQE
jgi:hypothetical protein